jgi:sulfotransferase
VDYDLLTQHPAKTMQLLYQFIQEPAFEHDFNAVEYEESEFDDKLGVKGLHSVRRKVEFKPRRTILPPDLFAKYQEMDFWQDNAGTAAHIIAPRKNVTKD